MRRCNSDVALHQYSSETSHSRCSSVPANFRSSRPQFKTAQHNVTTQANIFGVAFVKAHPRIKKKMKVRLVASEHELTISFLQSTDGLLHTFQLCQLELSHLAVGVFKDDAEMFMLSVLHHERLYNEVYFYPIDTNTKQWMSFFEWRKVPIMRLFDSIKYEMPRLILNSVRELTDSSSSREQSSSPITCDRRQSKCPH
jgi:hypothetical protein